MCVQVCAYGQRIHLQPRTGHSEQIVSVALSPDGHYGLTCDINGLSLLWDRLDMCIMTAPQCGSWSYNDSCSLNETCCRLDTICGVPLRNLKTNLTTNASQLYSPQTC